MIKGNKISKHYNGVSVLKDINIELAAGEITVLIGSSGSGKTTLLKMLSLLESPDEGSVTIDQLTHEFPSKKSKIRSQFKYNHGRQLVGVVFQNLDLIPHWSNKQNILSPLGKKLNKETYHQLDVYIQKFKMTSFIDKHPSQCSQGEQQRIAFVRAVMLKPKYLFLDEITSALDPELIAILFKHLLELKNKGVGIFVITHFLLFAQNLADKIVFIGNGEIIEQGTKNIMLSPGTKKLQDFLLSIGGIILNNVNPKVSDITTKVLGVEKDMYLEFKNAKSIKDKIRFSYRALDINDLSIRNQVDIYSFILDNFNDFALDLSEWLSIKSDEKKDFEILDIYIEERLENPKYPHHKSWIYLLSYKTNIKWKSKKEIIPLLKKYKNSENKINAEVAKNMLKEL